MGLRERKKQAIREALGEAALRLAIERGLDQVRVEDIAAAVEVSPRTFSNYFSSKEAAIVSIGVDRTARIGAALRGRPAGEPLPVALTRAYLEQYARPGVLDPAWQAQLRLILDAPALRGEYLKALVASEESLAEAIAARTGTDAARDLYPQVLAAAVSGAVRVAIRSWLDAGASAPLANVIRQAIALVAAGTPEDRRPPAKDADDP